MPLTPPTNNLSQDERNAMLRLAAEVLDDPVAMKQLCDRVYELMSQELNDHYERQRTYRRRGR